MKKTTISILTIFILLTSFVQAEWQDITEESTINDFNFTDWQSQKQQEGTSEDIVGQAFEIKQQFLASNTYEKSAYLLIIFFLLAVIAYLLYLVHIKYDYEKRLKKIKRKLKRK